MTNNPSQSFRASFPPGTPPPNPIEISSRYDKTTGQQIILWRDIQRVFENAKYVRNGSLVVSFLADENFQEILPERISHHPGVILEVVVADHAQRNESAVPLGADDAAEDAKECPSMPDLESLSIADIDPRQGVVDDTPAEIAHPTEEVKGSTTTARGEENLKANLFEAVLKMRVYMQDPQTNFLEGGPLRALSTLAYSSSRDFQRMAATMFAGKAVQGGGYVGPDVLKPIVGCLLRSEFTDVHEPALYALAKITYEDERNVLLAVGLGALERLARLVQSPDVDVHWIASSCIAQITVYDDNRLKAARSGAIVPLMRLAKSSDPRAQKNAVWALANLTGSDESMQELVKAGGMPVLVRLLSSSNSVVQECCTIALKNLTAESVNRNILLQTAPGLVRTLVGLLDSIEKIQTKAACVLANMARDETYRLEIARLRALPPLLRMSRSDSELQILSSVACLTILADYPSNDSFIVQSGFLELLIALLTKKSEKVQHITMMALHALIQREENRKAIFKAGLVERICNVALDVCAESQAGMASQGQIDEIDETNDITGRNLMMLTMAKFIVDMLDL
ncbi:Vacuolar protein 8 [Gamsiella multidivaricata]|nr:Vacuolar protein 8 [Gamsiella multidivaricata]